MPRTIILAAVVVLALAFSAEAAEFAVVVHPSNPVTSLDAQSVRALFLKTQLSWKHGERVRPIDLVSETAERAAFFDKVLGLTKNEFERYWVERQYSNGELPPLKAPDEASVINFVSTLKGTIAFVSREGAERAGEKVKIVMTVKY